MNWTKQNIKTQFERGKNLGWEPLIQTAATTYGFRSATLWALGSRETNLDPKYLRISGDGGHGFGLWQADIESYPQWIKSGAWHDAGMCAMFGAKVLNDKLNEIKNKADKAGLEVDEETALRLAIAAYNHGSTGVFNDFKRGLDPDKGTTGHDYSADTLKREKVFAEFLEDVPDVEEKPQINVSVEPTPVIVVKPDEPAVVVPKPIEAHPAGMSTWKSTVTGIWTSLGISVSSLGSIFSGAVKDPTLVKILIALGFTAIIGAGIFGLVYLIIRTIHIGRESKLAQATQLKEMEIKSDPTKYNVTALPDGK